MEDAAARHSLARNLRAERNQNDLRRFLGPTAIVLSVGVGRE